MQRSSKSMSKFYFELYLLLEDGNNSFLWTIRADQQRNIQLCINWRTSSASRLIDRLSWLNGKWHTDTNIEIGIRINSEWIKKQLTGITLSSMKWIEIERGRLDYFGFKFFKLYTFWINCFRLNCFGLYCQRLDYLGLDNLE